MGKNNRITFVFVFVVIVLMAIATFLAVDYTTGVVSAAVAFASTDQMAKLQACGVTPPPELFKLQADVPNFLLPAIYVGFPGLMIVIAIMMFIAGYYYGNENEGQSSSETTRTTSSPSYNRDSGRYEPGKTVEQTRTHRSSRGDA